MTISSQIQKDLENIYIDQIDQLLQEYQDPRQIISHLNTFIIEIYSNYIIQTQAQPQQEQSQLQAKPPLSQLEQQPLTQPQQPQSQLPQLQIVKVPVPTVPPKDTFTYIVSGNSNSKRIQQLLIKDVTSIKLVEFSFFNTIYNIDENSCHLEVNNQKYTIKSGIYNTKTLTNTLNDSIREQNIHFSIDNISQKTTIQYRTDGPNDHTKKRGMVFSIKFTSNLGMILGYTKRDYSSGEKYISETCHKINKQPCVTIKLDYGNKATLRENGSFHEFYVPKDTFGEWVTTTGPTFSFKKGILIDDFEIEINKIIEWKCIFEFECTDTSATC
jgi:hypothetical protein